MIFFYCIEFPVQCTLNIGNLMVPYCALIKDEYIYEHKYDYNKSPLTLKNFYFFTLSSEGKRKPYQGNILLTFITPLKNGVEETA